MPIGGILSAVAPTVIGGLLGSGQTSTGVPQGYQPINQGAIGNSLYNANTGYMPTAQQYYGMSPNYANSAFQSMYNNPYATGMQAAAGQAGQMAGQMAPAAYAAGQGAMGAGNQILNTAFDPQNALFNQQQHIVQDQSNATNSQYGLGSSGAGAGIANQNLQNFDINWQNNQLARQASGIQAYDAAQNSGLGMMGQGVNAQQQAGALPYNTAQGIATGQFGAINANQGAMQGAMQPYQQNINNMNAYLGLGQSAQAQANNQAYQQQLMQQQNMMGGAALGTYIGQQPGVQNALGNLFGGGNNQFVAGAGYGSGGNTWGSISGNLNTPGLTGFLNSGG